MIVEESLVGVPRPFLALFLTLHDPYWGIPNWPVLRPAPKYTTGLHPKPNRCATFPFHTEMSKFLEVKGPSEPWLLVDFFARILFLGVWMRVYVHLSVIPKALILSQKKFTFKSWMEGNPYEKKCAKCRKWDGGKLNVTFSPFCGKLHSNWNIFLLKRKLGQKQIVPLQPESREERQKKSPSPTHLSCFDFKMH